MNRKTIAYFLVGVFFGLLLLSLFNLQVIKGKHFRSLSDKNCIRLLPQKGSRGRILDRQGSVIAGNEIAYDVMVLASQKSSQQLDETFRGLSRILGIGSGELKKNFKKNFIEASVPVPVALDVERKKVIIIEELKADFGNVFIVPRPVRDYPHGALASHVLGYLHEIDRWRLTKLADYGYNVKDIVGFGGIEERYDYYLRQEEGGLLFEVDHRGRFVRALGFRPPHNGRDIQLTLDLKMQKIAEDVFAGHKGAVIIMDALTGEILVLASNPCFDPAAFIAKSSVYLQTVMNDRDAPMMNRAITGLYPPGSVFKLLIAQAALEANKINLSTTYTCPGYLKVGKQKFACWSTHHEQALLEAIAHSCNVFFYHTGLLIGPQQIYEYAVRFGFGRPVGVDLPYEAAGLVPNPFWKKIHQLRNWLDGDTANFSIGQGELLVTPLQVVRMMAVFANKGYLVTPHIVKAIDGKEVSFAKAKRQRLPLHEDALAQVNEGARRVVSLASGTASNLKLLPIAMAGKTGTAQAPPGLSHGWFAGFFPYDKPRYVLCVFVERGSAGYVASFLAKDMMEKMIAQGLFAKDEV